MYDLRALSTAELPFEQYLNVDIPDTTPEAVFEKLAPLQTPLRLTELCPVALITALKVPPRY